MIPESNFTPPSVLCPHPERYHSHDEDATEDEVTQLVAAMVRSLRPDFVLETGTYQGHTTFAIADALIDNDVDIVTIELDYERWLAAYDAFLGDPNVTVVHGRSLDYVPPKPIDFAWFDSAIDIRADEFRYFHSYMHSRTVVGFHDTAPHHPVRAQLDRLWMSGLMTIPLYLDTPRGCAFARPLFP